MWKKIATFSKNTIKNGQIYTIKTHFPKVPNFLGQKTTKFVKIKNHNSLYVSQGFYGLRISQP
jgi:hypothetical protein